MIAVGSPPVDLGRFAKESFPECSFVKKHEMCDFYPERGTLARPDRELALLREFGHAAE